MALLLRVDVEKPYGNHSFIRKITSKIIENYYPLAPRMFGYLDHLKIFLEVLNASNVKATFYHRICNRPHQDLVKYYVDHGHELGLHLENSISYETVKNEIDCFEQLIMVEIKTISKHGSGYQKLGKFHYPLYEPEKYKVWAKQLQVEFPCGNGIAKNIQELWEINGYFENVFWMENEYRDENFNSVDSLIEAAKERDVVILIHPESYLNSKRVREDFAHIVEKAKILGIEWNLLSQIIKM